MIFQLYDFVHSRRMFAWFTWFTRILLAIAFLPSGYKKVAGLRFTNMPVENPVGYFFEALYQTGFYWNFLGGVQLLAALLIVIPRTAFFGAILYLPVIVNIFVIVTAMGFIGTPYIVGMMLLANLYLLFYELPKLQRLARVIFAKD